MEKIMIANDKELSITKTQMLRFEESLEVLKNSSRPDNIHPKLWRAEQDATLSTLEKLRECTDSGPSRQRT